MIVKDLMVEDIKTININENLQSVANKILKNNVGSVIIMSEDKPHGIITKSDMIKAVYVLEKPFTKIQISKVVDENFHTVKPNTTIRKAAKKMEEKNIKKLLVIEDLKIQGIITLTDIVFGIQKLLKEAHEIEDLKESWEKPSEYFDIYEEQN